MIIVASLIGITIINFISIYLYIAHIPTGDTPLVVGIADGSTSVPDNVVGV